MYWIVFALFSAVESLLDPFGNIFLPFYTEVETHYYRYIITMTMAAGESGAAALPLSAPHPRLGRGVQEVAPPPPLQQGDGDRQDAGAGAVRSRAANYPSVFTITEKAPTSAFTFKTLLRHYAQQALNHGK